MEGMMRDLVRYGFGSDRPIDTPAGPLSPAEFAAAFFSGSPDAWAGPLFGFGGEPGPLLRQVQARGLLEGRTTRFTLTYSFPAEQDADNIAATLAVGCADAADPRTARARPIPARSP